MPLGLKVGGQPAGLQAAQQGPQRAGGSSTEMQGRKARSQLGRLWHEHRMCKLLGIKPGQLFGSTRRHRTFSHESGRW